MDLPKEAALSPSVTKYAVDLSVRVIPIDLQGRELQETQLPPVYVIWTQGLQGAPKVWDRVQLAKSEPHSWDPDDNGVTTPGSPGIDDDVIIRWEGAAQSRGYGTAHANQKNNGQDH